MADDDALTITLRPRSQPIAMMVALAFAALFVYSAVAPSGPSAFGNSPALDWALAVVLLIVAAYAAWRAAQPGRWRTVIDAEGIHQHPSGRTMRWDEVYYVGVSSGGGTLDIAEHPDSGGFGIGIDLAHSDGDEDDILAAIRRCSELAGCAVEPGVIRPSARASARSR